MRQLQRQRLQPPESLGSSQAASRNGAISLTRLKVLSLQILACALSAFMLWRVPLKVSWIVEHPQTTSLGAVLVEAITLNFGILCIFFVAFAWPLHRLIPNSYYEAVRSNTFAVACKIFRVELFRTFLRRTLWHSGLSKRLFYNRLIFDGTRKDLAQYDDKTRRAEFIHSAAFVTSLPVSLYIGIFADPLLATGMFLVNVIWNFYPSMVQRCQRSKRLLRRK